MTAKRYTRSFSVHSEEHSLSSVLQPISRIALAAAVASACQAHTAGMWQEFSEALPAGGDVVVTGDVAFESNLRVDKSASVTGEGGTMLDGGALESRMPGIYATETLSFANLGTFTTDEEGFIQNAADLQGGIRNFSGGAVVIEQYAVGKRDVHVTVADTVFAENGRDMTHQVDGGAFAYRERT